MLTPPLMTPGGLLFCAQSSCHISHLTSSFLCAWCVLGGGGSGSGVGGSVGRWAGGLTSLLAPWQKLGKKTNKQFCKHMGTKNAHVDPCKTIETITKSCKYQSNCKSKQNAPDTKPWKGCKNTEWAAERRVKKRGVITGGVTLFMALGFSPYVPIVHPISTIVNPILTPNL